MTNEELIKVVGRSIAKAIRSNAINKKAADAVLLSGAGEMGIISCAVVAVQADLAKAVIEALAPMMREMRTALDELVIDRRCETMTTADLQIGCCRVCRARSLASLPECWKGA